MVTNLPCETRFSLSSRRRVESLAGVAELADALVLGTSSSECGFESLRPHVLPLTHWDHKSVKPCSLVGAS